MLHDFIDTSLLPTFPPEALEEVKREGQIRTLEPGEALFTEGQEDPEIFVVLSGEVRVSRHIGGEEAALAVYRPGEFIGEISRLVGGPATGTARAVGQVRVLQVSADSFRRMVAECTPLAKAALRSMVTRQQELEVQ